MRRGEDFFAGVVYKTDSKILALQENNERPTDLNIKDDSISLLVLQENNAMIIVDVKNEEGKQPVVTEKVVKLRKSEKFINFCNKLEKGCFNQIVLEKDFISAPGHLIDESKKSGLYYSTNLMSWNIFTRLNFFSEGHSSVKDVCVLAFEQLGDIAKDFLLVSRGNPGIDGSTQYFVTSNKAHQRHFDMMDETDQRWFIKQIHQTEERLFVLVDSTWQFRKDFPKHEPKLEPRPWCLEFDRRTHLLIEAHKGVNRVYTEESMIDSTCDQWVAFQIDDGKQS